MAVPIETVRGTHYEMGFAHGKALRHLIHGLVSKTMRHTFEESEEELDRELALIRKGDETFSPWIFEELRGIADGSGVALEHLERTHLRVWTVPRKAIEHAQCTSVGMISEDVGVIVGGTLDDPRAPYVLLRRLPRDGIPHVTIARAGACWGHNGVNEAGLAVSQSSLGGYDPAPSRLAPDPLLRSAMGTRIMLETCRSVPEVLALLGKMRTESNYVIGDAQGNLVACQCLRGFDPVVQHADDHGGMVFSTNHIHMPELVAKLAAQDSQPVIPEHTSVRFAVVERWKATMPRSKDTFMALLRSHERYPHSVCRDATAYATFSVPQQEPSALHVADHPPCRSDFCRFPVISDA